MRRFVVVFLLACNGGSDPAVDAGVDAPSGPWRSSLYPADWTPGFQDAEGRRLPDFSYAGYKYGDAVPVVAGPTVDVGTYGALGDGTTDDGPAIQAAVDAASKGGVIRFDAKPYRIATPVVVRTSGIVLRGAGRGKTRLFIEHVTASPPEYLRFEGAEKLGPDDLLASDARGGDSSVVVSDPSAFKTGDEVAVGFVVTDAFVAAHGMTGVWSQFNGQWRPFFHRRVVSVDVVARRVVLDVPLRYDVLVRDGASVRSETGFLHDVGIEDLTLGDAGDYDRAWTRDRLHALSFHAVADAWAVRLDSAAPPWARDEAGAPTDRFHFESGGVFVDLSARVTLRDLSFAGAQNRGSGGDGYLVELSRSNEVLVADAVGRRGRHNFIQNWDFGTSGCVFLRTTSQDGISMSSKGDTLGLTGTSEFHHSLAMENLIDDSVADDGWKCINRGLESSGAGHAGTSNVFWNVRGKGILTSKQYRFGYVVGTGPELVVDTRIEAITGAGTEPEDWVEGAGRASTLVPQSLYEDQRLRRLSR